MAERYQIGQAVILPGDRVATVEDVYDQTHSDQRVRVAIDERYSWFEARELEHVRGRRNA